MRLRGLGPQVPVPFAFPFAFPENPHGADLHQTRPAALYAAPFPPYRYLPYRSGATQPHPHNDPAGHSYHAEEEYLPSFTPEDWRSCQLYLYGIDLFNHGYWWEAHEALEDVWLAAGQRETVCGRFVQGLIQLAAAQLKRFMAESRGAESLTAAGVERIAEVEGIYLGIAVAELVAEAGRCLQEDGGVFPRIELCF